MLLNKDYFKTLIINPPGSSLQTSFLYLYQGLFPPGEEICIHTHVHTQHYTACHYIGTKMGPATSGYLYMGVPCKILAPQHIPA